MKRNVLVIGSGGREHAIAWKLRQSELVDQLYVAPGNPGTAGIAQNLSPRDNSPEAYLELAESVGVDFTVVGPEAPLVAGVVDAFRSRGHAIFGPTRAAARLEGSKVFAKEFLARHSIPTAQALTAPDAASAQKYLDAFGFPVVLKADGLAAGKGVIIAQDRSQARSALFDLPPGPVLIEQYLTGEEVSFIVLADGETAVPLEATQDHKAVHDGDEGPNTGGMGAYSDGRILSTTQIDAIMRDIIHPTLAGMLEAATPYTGFLYAGLMMTSEGPKVLEFNARLGDPETQPLMHRLSSDFGALLLEKEPARWNPDPSVCVVLAAHGYPVAVRTGDPITGLDRCPAVVFHAGTKRTPQGLVTAGGRVVGVTASGADLPTAIANTYAAIDFIHFDGMHFRRDIGRKGVTRWI